MATEVAIGANFCISTGAGALFQGLAEASNALIEGANKKYDHAKFLVLSESVESTNVSVKKASIDDLVNELLIRYKHEDEPSKLCKDQSFEKIKLLLNKCENYYVITKELYDKLNTRQEAANKISLAVSSTVSTFGNYLINENLNPIKNKDSLAIGAIASVAAPEISAIATKQIVKEKNKKKKNIETYEEIKNAHLKYETPHNIQEAKQNLDNYYAIFDIAKSERKIFDKLIKQLNTELNKIKLGESYMEEIDKIKEKIAWIKNKILYLKTETSKTKESNKSDIEKWENELKYLYENLITYMDYQEKYESRKKDRSNLNIEISNYEKTLEEIDFRIKEITNILELNTKYINNNSNMMEKMMDVANKPFTKIKNITQKVRLAKQSIIENINNPLHGQSRNKTFRKRVNRSH